jgi:2-oxoisovalerate dehydrogenase E1 component alpha subunit
VRFRLFLESQGWWSAGEEEALKARQKTEVMEAFKRAENRPKGNLVEMFQDVYGGEQPWMLVRIMMIIWIAKLHY